MTIENQIPSVTDVGEFALIERIKTLVGSELPPDVILGIGDDCAAIRVAKDRALIATCDMHYEETHFLREHDEDGAETIGRRAVAVNLSDLAAMGATPRFALLSLGFPKNYASANFDRMYKGMVERLREFGAVVIGGNLTSSGQRVVIDIFLLGEAHPDRIMKRNGARAGDRIFVTGQIGTSAAGLRMNRKYILDHVPPYLHYFTRIHNEPEPRIAFGKLLAESKLATSCIDISDGLAADLGHLCSQSNCGARIEWNLIPRHAALHAVLPHIAPFYKGVTEEDLVLHGGEDYELLFTVSAGHPVHKVQAVADATKTEITEIGMMVESARGMLIVAEDGTEQTLEPRGWDHFRR